MTLTFDGELFAKLTFVDWGKEKMTYSLQGKVAAAEGNVQQTTRPWEALATLMARAVVQSDTKKAMADLGISLHNVKSTAMYSVQFVCNRCRLATDVLYPVCEDRRLRDQADRTMVQLFKPYFEHMHIPLPAPPPPPPPALAYV